KAPGAHAVGDIRRKEILTLDRRHCMMGIRRSVLLTLRVASVTIVAAAPRRSFAAVGPAAATRALPTPCRIAPAARGPRPSQPAHCCLAPFGGYPDAADILRRLRSGLQPSLRPGPWTFPAHEGLSAPW